MSPPIRSAARRQPETGHAKRTWKVTRQPGAPFLPKLAWSLTIADVAAGGPDGSFPDAARYRELVTRWARVTLQEMKPLLPE